MTTIIIPILVLGALIFVHELGHFLLAKYYGVGVLEFALGFGPKVLSLQIGETKYTIRLIPLGGFVRMVGDDPTRLEELSAGGLSEQSQQPPFGGKESEVAPEVSTRQEREIDLIEKRLLAEPHRWFLNQKVSAKIMIVLAGPLFNFLFAYAIAVYNFGIYGLPEPIDKPIIGRVDPGKPAELAGLQVGDQVLSVNGREVATWVELAKLIQGSKGELLRIEIKRADQRLKFELNATDSYADEIAVIEGREPPKENRPFFIGIQPKSENIKISWGESFYYGGIFIYDISLKTLRGLFGLIKGLISPSSIRGPIFIFSATSSSAKQGMQSLLYLMLLLNITLAVLNLLPIPVLDGGHIMFFLIEAARGKAMNVRIVEVATQVGMLFLLCLMVFALSNDIRSLVGF
ncbi:MAG TPA: RIP metalloprotease RseP [Oligoflexia bacterium]|nr:RIP metalloprotease RseP [Oligoflexia bacterium]HMP27777.1 RIP metalloprotease RseP [Oligoflexia bacterium]